MKNTNQSQMMALVVAALAVRLVVGILAPGTVDVDNFVATARAAQQGLNVYEYHTAYPYPPPYSYLLAATLTLTDALGLDPRLAVRLPNILADCVLAALVLASARRLYAPRVASAIGWAYALNPVTIMVASHHGQLDPLAYLPAMIALWLAFSAGNPWWMAFCLGLGGALKVTPMFLATAWWPDQKSFKRFILWNGLAGLLFLVSMGAGWLSAPEAFRANVLGYNARAEGGIGYNMFTLIAEIGARRLGLGAILGAADLLRRSYKLIIILGVLLTAWWTRRKPFLQRAFLIQIAVQLFAGHWGHEYGVWLVPLALLINQRGALPYFAFTTIWMLLGYFAFASVGVLRDNLFRGTTVVMFMAWLSLLAWYLANLGARLGRPGRWLTATLWRSEDAREG